MAKGFQIKYGNPEVRYYPEHATPGSFQAGDVVDLDGGAVRIAAADSKIWGIAAANYTGTAATSIPVYVIDEQTLYVAWCDTTFNRSHVGNNFGLNIAAGSCTVDIGDTTTTSVVIIDVDDRDSLGATSRALVRFLPAVLQTGAAA